jgi:hypothetical protein
MPLFIFAILIPLSAPKQRALRRAMFAQLPSSELRFLARAAAATTVHLAHFNSPAGAHAIHRLECSRQECLLPAGGKLERKGMVVVPFARPADLTIRLRAIRYSPLCVKINVYVFFHFVRRRRALI